MSCNCCPYMHKTTAISTAGVLTVTNPNNVGNFDRFCLCFTINPSSVVTTSPVALTVTINGVAVPIVDEWGYPVMSDKVVTRKKYVGRYITLSDDSHVTLENVPCVTQSGSVTAVTNTESGS